MCEFFKCKYILFVDDLEIYCSIYNIHDHKFLLLYIGSVQDQCFESGMIFDVCKTAVVSSMCKPVSINVNYK
jgi:hypothetical protein